MGAIVCLLLSTPLTPLTRGILADVFDLNLPAWISIWSMCLAALAAAAILRRRIRVRFAKRLAMTGIVSVYLAASVFPVFFCLITSMVGGLVMPGISLRPWSLPLLVVIPFGAILSPVVATVSLHMAGPAGIAFSFILRYIDPPENDLSEAERRLVRIVDECRAEGCGMITQTDILERAEGDKMALALGLVHLRSLGILRWDGSTGFRHKS